MDAVNIRNVFQSRYNRKPSTWSKIGIPYENLDNIDLELVVTILLHFKLNAELSCCPSRNFPF